MADPNRPPRPPSSAAGHDTGFVPSVHDPIYTGSLPPHPHPGIIGGHRARAAKPTGADHMRVLFPPSSTPSHASIDTQTASAIDGLAYCHRNILSSLGGSGTTTTRSALATGGFTGPVDQVPARDQGESSGGHVADQEGRSDVGVPGPGGHLQADAKPFAPTVSGRRDLRDKARRTELAPGDGPVHPFVEPEYALAFGSPPGGEQATTAPSAPSSSTGLTGLVPYHAPIPSTSDDQEWHWNWLNEQISEARASNWQTSTSAASASAPVGSVSLAGNGCSWSRGRRSPTPGSEPETGLDRRQPMDTSNGGATPTGHGLTQAQMVDSSSAGTNPDDVSRRPDTIGSQRGATDTTGARFDGNDFPPLSDHSINRADPSASPSSSTADTAPAMGESRTTLGERKTKLCLYEFFFYPRSGISCAHGSRCKYAHNLRELRAVTPPIHDILYKATLCPTHMAGAFCAAFTNCPMAHGEEELRVNRAYLPRSSSFQLTVCAMASFFPRIPDDVHVPLPPAEEPSSSPTYLKDLTTPPHTDKPASSSNNGLPPSLRPDTIDSQRGATDTTGARFDDNDFPPLSDATTSSSSRAGPSSSSSSSSTADTAPAMRDRRTTLCNGLTQAQMVDSSSASTKPDDVSRRPDTIGSQRGATDANEARFDDNDFPPLSDHTTSSISRADPSSSSSSSTADTAPAMGERRTTVRPFWQEENKTCTKGSACKNAHGGEELRVVPRAEGWRPRGPCKMFANGWCRFGANCCGVFVLRMKRLPSDPCNKFANGWYRLIRREPTAGMTIMATRTKLLGEEIVHEQV
uniref:C3H1-type domain-containing protein n=1 Tax=Oryza brachyantha TaxID=4533 RepID=J3MIH3_ORYBR